MTRHAGRAGAPVGSGTGALPWALLFAAGAALSAQLLLDEGSHIEVALTLLTAALGVVIGGLDLNDCPEYPSRVGRAGTPLPAHWRRACAAAAIACAVVAFAGLAGNTFSFTGTCAWLASVLFVVAACAAVPNFASRPIPDARRAAGTPWRERGLLAAILIVAAVLLFIRLGEMPADPTSDHAEKLLDVRDVMRGLHPIYFPRNTGREAIIFYWTAFWSEWLGFGYWTLKFSTALLGLLCVAATYRFARMLFGSAVGLAAAFLLAASSWHLAISRIGLRYPLGPLASALALAWLYRALRSGGRNDWLCAGLALGAGQYGYTSARILLPLYGVWLLLRVTIDRRAPADGETAVASGVGTMLAAAAVVLIPMLRIACEMPEQFLQRSLTRTTDLEVALPHDLLRQFLVNLGNALLMFNWRGHIAWFVCGDGRPMLDPVSGTLLVLGIAVLVAVAVRRRDRRPLYIVSALVILILPSALSLAFPNENPSANRAAIALPVVATIAALPIGVLARHAVRARARVLISVATLVAAAVAILAMNIQRYFVDCVRLYRSSVPNTEEIATTVRDFLARGGTLGSVYLVAWPHWLDHRLVGLAAGDIGWSNLLNSVDDARHTDDSGPRLYILHPNDADSLARLHAIEPRGTARVVPSQRQAFVVFEVPRQR